MTIINNLLKVLFISVWLNVSVYAGGGGLTGGATEFTQIANNVELVALLVEAKENIDEQIRQFNKLDDQYETMVQNLEKIKDFNGLKSNAQSSLETLASLVAYGEAVAYSSINLENEFKEKYQGYEKYLALERSEENYETYGEIYENWIQTSQDAIQGALKAANLQHQQFDSESAALNSIQNEVETAKGALQALQAGSAIAAQQITQMQKLRQLVQAQMQMQANYMALRTDMLAEEKAIQQKAKEPKQRDPDSMPVMTIDDVF